MLEGSYFPKLGGRKMFSGRALGHRETWALLLNPKSTVKRGVSAQSQGRSKAMPEEGPSY